MWQLFSKSARKLLLMFFSLGPLIQFQYDFGKNNQCWKKESERKEKELYLVLSGFGAWKICRPSVLSYRHWDRQRETHCLEPDRMEREKESGGREGGREMNWDGIGPNFQATHPPPPHPLLLNTEKCTFCFQRISFIDKVTGSCALRSPVYGRKPVSFGGNLSIQRRGGAGGGWCLNWWVCSEQQGCVHTHMKRRTAFELKIDPHILLVSPQWPQRSSHPGLLQTFAGLSWTWNHVYGHVKEKSGIQ